MHDLAELEYYWTGGFRAPGSDPVTGPWAWTDGSEWTYENWKLGRPNNFFGGEYYVKVESYGVWNDDSDSYIDSSKFVCQYRI